MGIMKKRDLEKQLRKLGWTFKRQGGNHELWTNGLISQPIPRHNEIKEMLAKAILEIAKNNPGEL